MRLLVLGIAALSAVAPLTAQVPAARIDSVFARYNRTDAPGCALGVFRDGRIAYARGYGMADLNQGIAIDPRTVFYIASTSKQFAAASLSLLAVQGKLSLSDPVKRYVPELPAWADGITVAHLMGHQSGIRDYLGLWGMSGRLAGDEIPEEQALDLIARQRATDFAPGTKWSYSNSGYFLISLIVKRVSGQSLREFAAANLFGPLGMRDTHFHDDRTMIVPHRAEGYEPDGKGGYHIYRTSFALVGDGGLLTTVEDLAKWDENFFDNRLAGGGPAFIQRLTTRGVLANGDTTNYAAGLFIDRYRGQPIVSHGGAFIGYRAELLRFPALHTSIAILCNDYTAAPEAMAKQVADVVLGDKLSSAAAVAAGSGGTARVAPATLDRYAGRYELMPGLAATVARKDSGLVVSFAGMQLPFVPTSDSTFTNQQMAGTMTFRAMPGGKVGLTFPPVGLEAPTASLGPTPTLTPADRQAIVGRYACDELATTFTVREQGGALQVRAGYGDWRALMPFAPGVFSTGDSRITVERDKAGKVTGLRLDAARMLGIKLLRAP